MGLITFTRRSLLITITLWWCFVVALSLTDTNILHLRNIFGFLFLALIPGILTVACLRLDEIAPWGKLVLAVAFSILELMLTGLLSNMLSPYFGVERPLDLSSLIVWISLLVIGLMIIVWFRVPQLSINLADQMSYLFPKYRDVFLAFFPVIFVLQSIAGAISLNNGGTNLWTLTMLGEMGIFILLLIRFSSDTRKSSAIPTAIFFISLSLLLMTSLRGWYITGHDIQLEYHLFELTKNMGVWKMSSFNDPYNACLSITILPTIFFNFLKISDPYIYKILFQTFFALCPVLTYLIARFSFGAGIGLLSGFYFAAFPTFFSDMPFLTRQEIAFLFFGSLLYIIFNRQIDLRLRQVLFIVMGTGIIFSHYSTTYTILFIFGLMVITKLSLKFVYNIFIYKKKIQFFRSHPIIFTYNFKDENRINFWIVSILFALSFLWTSIITNTGGNFSKVILQTTQAMSEGFFENNRSVDVLALFSFKKVDQQFAIDDYIEKVVEPKRANSQDIYYSKNLYEKYEFMATKDEKLPLTKTGISLKTLGFDVSNFIPFFGQFLSKIMLVLIPIGFLALVRKALFKQIDREYLLLAFYCLVFIFLNAVLPVFSTSYGIFRAMQQSMFVLAPMIIIGSTVIVYLIKKLIGYIMFSSQKNPISHFVYSKVANLLPLIILSIFFLYVTAFIPYLFGGNVPVLFLSNAGKYYDNYYIRTGEVYGMYWLLDYQSQASFSTQTSKLQTDNFSRKKILTIINSNVAGDLFPGLIEKESYVFLGTAAVNRHTAWVAYNGDPIEYTYPIEFLDENKNLLYNNGFSRVYR